MPMVWFGNSSTVWADVSISIGIGRISQSCSGFLFDVWHTHQMIVDSITFSFLWNPSSLFVVSICRFLGHSLTSLGFQAFHFALQPKFDPNAWLVNFQFAVGKTSVVGQPPLLGVQFSTHPQHAFCWYHYHSSSKWIATEPRFLQAATDITFWVVNIDQIVLQWNPPCPMSYEPIRVIFCSKSPIFCDCHQHFPIFFCRNPLLLLRIWRSITPVADFEHCFLWLEVYLELGPSHHPS